MTGYEDAECTSSNNCIQADGSGYYIIQGSENGNTGHEVHLDGGTDSGFTTAFTDSTLPPFFWASLNWLATRASGAVGVTELSTPTG